MTDGRCERVTSGDVVAVRDLSVAIGGVDVVHGLGFTIGAGERLALLGPSGAGKSLTAAAVLGRLPPRARPRGSVRLGGVEVLDVPAARRGRAVRVAGIGQDARTALNPLVRVGAQLRAVVRAAQRHGPDGAGHDGPGRDGEAASDVVLGAALAASGLTDPARVLAAHTGELSGGQRQRVALTFALAARPHLLVADEPTTALDPDTRRLVLDLLDERLAATGAALLFITHDTDAANELCTRTVRLRDGRIEGDIEGDDDGRAARVRGGGSDGGGGAPTRVGPPTTARPRPPQPPSDRESGWAPADGDVGDAGDAVVRARGLHRVHPDPRRRGEPVRALRGVDLDLFAGERVGLAGTSGAGKSTLLRILLALDRADAGRVTVAGRDVVPGRVRALRWFRRLVQYVPQDPVGALDPRMTVRDLVAEPLARLGLPGERAAAVRAVLDRVGLPAGAADRRPGELSGGQAQRVALARALVVRPRLLLADEPLGGLDPGLRDQVVALFGEVCAEDGTGLLLVAHDHDVLLRLCPRTVVLADGVVVADGPTTAALSPA